MTTIEKLFVQIFERKKRIIEQVKQQTDLFEQHLASKCILDGVAPPSWLWSPSFPSLSSDPNELKKEELIPGLLLPRPQPANPYSSTHDSLCQKSIFTSGYKGLQNVSCTEVHASNIGTTADDGMSVLPPLPTIDTQCTFNGVPEPDCSIASPQDCVDTTTADNCLDHVQSLVKIQRSKSRQRALELRNSAKATKSHSCNENDAIVFASQDIGCGISSLRFDHFDEVELVRPVDRSTVDRSTEGCEEEAEIGKCAGENSSRGNRSGSSSPKITSVNKPENDDNSSHFAKDDGHKKSMNELTQKHNHVNALSELDNSAVLAKANCFAETATLVDFRGNEMNNTVFSDRITGSRSSIYRASASKNPFVDISSCVEEDGGHIESVDKSAKQHSSVSELLKLVKPLSAVPHEIYGSRKAKARNRLMKRKGSDIFVGRITRSRSSSLKPNCVNKCLEMDNSCCNGKEDGVSNPKQLLNHDNDSRDLVNTLGTTCASPELKAETLNFQNVDAYCQRLTSSSSNEKPCDIREFPKVDLSSNVIKDGDSKPAQSFGKSSQLPQQSSFVEGGGATLQFLSDSQPNVLPCTKSNPAETDMDYDGLVVACSVSSESDSDGRGCVVENLELRPPSECDMPIKPKQLNFDDVKESNFLETSSLVLEHKQEGTSEKQLSTMLQPMDLGKVTPIGYQGNPNPSIEMPLLEEQEFSNKEKSWKVSIEGHMKDGAVLADESTINPLQKKTDLFFSQNQNADSYFMGSWPQHKRIKIEGELTKALSASPSLKIGDAPPQPNEGRVPLKDMHQNVEHQKIEEYEVSSSQLQVEEIEISSEGRGRTASTAFNLMLEQVAPLVSSFKELAAGEVTGQHATEEKVSFQHEDKLEVGVDEILTYNEDIVLERKDHLDQNDNLSYCSTGSHCQSVICADQSMPEFEGFVLEADYEQPCTSKEATHFGKLDLPPTGLGCASVLEQFCTSTSQHTPLLDFSSTHKLHKALNLYHSIPNGLLEDIQLRSTLYMQGDRNEQLGNSFSCFKQEVNHALHGRSHSVSLPFSNPQSAWDVRKPGVSPLGKLWDGIPPKSSSSGKRVSSIPELPCISEENENTDGVADTTLEGTIPEVIISSVKRQPLADITKNSNPLVSVSEAEVKDDRSSLASLNTELSFSGTCGRARPKLRNQNKNKRRFTNKDKENENLPREGDGPKRGNGSLHGRFSKPKLSGKTDLIKGGLGLSEKESKHNNIVSNVTSFIPLLQQKQATAVITGKRDIKVKALEAAEAAKRLAEKKENERKMKKEALKLERARMEEQNLRQLELEKKKKEEQKKKEADMAAKKRQREDEDRKERERKRKRVEEGKRHQLEQEKKLRMLKEQKEDERAHEKKEYKDRLGKHYQIEKAEGDQNLRTVPHMESTTTKVSTSGTINASIIAEDSEALSDCGDKSKVTDYFGKDSDSLISNLSREQSYEISPYKGSDDEDEDDDDNRPTSKFIPSWASKSHLARVISSQQKYPESIFPPESFCSISEVLLPRKLQQK